MKKITVNTQEEFDAALLVAESIIFCTNGNFRILDTKNAIIRVGENATIEYVGGNAIIEHVAENATIEHVAENATIEYVGENATIEYVGENATIEYVGGNATIEHVAGKATIEYVGENATIEYVGGNATIEHVLENATIEHVAGKATIKYVAGNATIEYVGGNAIIEHVAENATIKYVLENATIKHVYGNATIKYVLENATISRVAENATIEHVGGNATIERVGGNATIGSACGNVIIRVYDCLKIKARQSVIIIKYSKDPLKIEGGNIIEANKFSTPAEWCSFYGLDIIDNIVILYKAVDISFHSPHAGDYTPGTIPAASDWDGGVKECGGGLHFSPTPLEAREFYRDAKRFVACPISLNDMVVHPHGQMPEKVKARCCCAKVWEVDIDGNKI